jgi:hypothetical protein
MKYKKAGHPILNSYEYLRQLVEPKKYSCAQPKVFITLSENGEIVPFWCVKKSEVLGDLRKQSLSEVLYSDSYVKYAKSTDTCSRCNDSVNVETSMFYSVQNFLTYCLRIPNPVIGFILDYACWYNSRWGQESMAQHLSGIVVWTRFSCVKGWKVLSSRVRVSFLVGKPENHMTRNGRVCEWATFGAAPWMRP